MWRVLPSRTSRWRSKKNQAIQKVVPRNLRKLQTRRKLNKNNLPPLLALVEDRPIRRKRSCMHRAQTSYLNKSKKRRPERRLKDLRKMAITSLPRRVEIVSDAMMGKAMEMMGKPLLLLKDSFHSFSQLRTLQAKRKVVERGPCHC